MNMKTAQLIKRLLHYVKPYRFLLFIAVISSLISVAASLLTPVLIGDAIDYIVGKDNVAAVVITDNHVVDLTQFRVLFDVSPRGIRNRCRVR